MKPQNHSFLLSAALALPLAVLPARGIPVELSDTPISSASSTQVKPNVLFVMDDSLSMELDYLPDWAGGSKPSWLTTAEAAVHYDYPRRLYQTRNPDFNGVTYDPTVTYVPPKYFNASGELDETAYPSQDRAETNGWPAVKNAGYGIQPFTDPNGTMNLNGLAFYYTTVPGEYCTDRTLRTCNKQDASSPTYPVPAKLRWCRNYNTSTSPQTNPGIYAAQTSPGVGLCGAIEIDGTKATTSSTSYTNTPYHWPRMPRPRISVIYFSGSASTTVSSVKVPVKMDDGTVETKEILSGTTIATTDANNVAEQVAAQINACSFSLPASTNCQVVGHRAEAMYYSATLGFVYILMPRDPGSTAAATAAPVLAGTGMASTPYRYGTASSITSGLVYASSSRPLDLFYQGYTTASTSYTVPGDNVLTVITPEREKGKASSYPKAASRTDCEGETCTYDEEMTNFANWWAYYRTRMQAMKSAASRSFEKIDDRFRIGYYSINNNTGSDFQNVSEFDGAQKHEWYEKLFDATPYRTDSVTADTPLRVALSEAGRLYAFFPGDETKQMNGVDAVDPMQHFCQTNVTILSTDGYWNLGAGYMLDGSTPVGEQDGYVNGVPLEERPMLDGDVTKYNQYRILKQVKLTPTEEIWNRIKTTQWQVQENVRQKIREKISYYSTSQLQEKTAQSEPQDWQLQINRRNVYHYYPTTEITAWQYRTRMLPLESLSGPLQKRSGHLQISTQNQKMRQNGQLQSQTGKLQTRTLDLQRRYTWAQKKTSSNGGINWSGWTNVESCTPVTTGNNLRQCQKLTTASAWINVKDDPNAGVIADNTSAQCKTVAGATETTGAGTDNEITTYNTTVGCQYTSPAWTDVAEGASCPTQVAKSTGNVLTVLNPVECQASSGWWGYQNVSSCTTTAKTSTTPAVTCTYQWSDPVADDACDSKAVPPSSGPNYTVEHPVKCTSDGWTAFVDTDTCATGANTRCQYSWAADGSDWNDDPTGNCQKSPGIDTFTAVNATDCRINATTWTVSADGTCTEVSTGPTRTQCRPLSSGTWSAWSGWNDGTCSGKTNDSHGSGPTYLPLMQCETRRGTTTNVDVCAPTIKDADDNDIPNPYYNATYCNVCTNSSHPDYADLCVSEWRGWTNASSCTPSGAEGDPDAVQCRYVLTQDWALKGRGECTPNELTPTPTHNALLGAGTYKVGTPRYCRLKFDVVIPQTVSTCNPGTSTNSQNDVQCEYTTWTTPSPSPSCTEQAQSTGTGVWVGPACKITEDWGAFRELADGETCPAVNTSTVECETTGDGWVNYPRSDETWDNFPDAPEDTATERYREEVVTDWTPALTQLPTAGASNLPNNFAALARSCTAGPDQDTGVVTYCEPHVPKASSAFNYTYTSCASLQSSASLYGVDVACTETESLYNSNLTTCSDQESLNGIEYKCVATALSSTPDTLADVAEYYWKTDLRTPERGNCEGGPVGSGGVSSSGVCANTDTIPRQNMITFTLGLGASGVMQFQPDYGSYTDPKSFSYPNEPLPNPLEGGDIYSITMGVEAKPTEGICSWQVAGTRCNWPKPASNQQTNIDDLWHAAINGRGTYFSAENPSMMAAGISAALQEVLVKEGSRTPPTFDGNELEEDSAVFMAKFTAETWTGDLEKFDVDLANLTKGDRIWSAKSLLDARAYTDRTIYLFDEEEVNKLKSFAWGSLDADQQAKFTKPHIEAGLSQLCTSLASCLPATLHDEAGGEALVNFLRGDRSNEGVSTDTAKYFRQRMSVLGDIVNSGPVYVQKPTRRYSDPGYGDFKEDNDERTGMVYVGANDGMLHAFNADTGAETWAFVPGMILDDLHRLADKSYATRHRFFVDGTPVVGDVCVADCNDVDGAEWKTLLVGGLNHGGQGYYALDVTNPANPKGLWEFTNPNLGYTYGNPVITKLTSGQWVVMVTSGYNNVNDGKGRLFILDAYTGAQIGDAISTGAGSSATPSGLAKISNFVNYPDYNNLTLRVYGGDLLGNLWRFDVNDAIPPAGREAQRLATLKSEGEEGEEGEAQPITIAPQLGMINNRYPVVFVGTGQLLGNPDLETTGIQSLYAIKDTLTALDYGNPRDTAVGSFVEQTMGEGVCSTGNPYCEPDEAIVTVTKHEVDWTTKDGWYVDFPEAGERVVTNIDLRDSILSIVTNTPQSGACVPVGTSNLYYLDYKTGGYVAEGTDNQARFGEMNSLGSEAVPTYDPNGKTIWQGGDDTSLVPTIQMDPEISEKVRRISWRELLNE